MEIDCISNVNLGKVKSLGELNLQFISMSGSRLQACVCRQPSKDQIGDIALPELEIQIGVLKRALSERLEMMIPTRISNNLLLTRYSSAG